MWRRAIVGHAERRGGRRLAFLGHWHWHWHCAVHHIDLCARGPTRTGTGADARAASARLSFPAVATGPPYDAPAAWPSAVRSAAADDAPAGTSGRNRVSPNGAATCAATADAAPAVPPVSISSAAAVHTAISAVPAAAAADTVHHAAIAAAISDAASGLCSAVNHFAVAGAADAIRAAAIPFRTATATATEAAGRCSIHAAASAHRAICSAAIRAASASKRTTTCAAATTGSTVRSGRSASTAAASAAGAIPTFASGIDAATIHAATASAADGAATAASTAAATAAVRSGTDPAALTADLCDSAARATGDDCARAAGRRLHCRRNALRAAGRVSAAARRAPAADARAASHCCARRVRLSRDRLSGSTRCSRSPSADDPSTAGAIGLWCCGSLVDNNECCRSECPARSRTGGPLASTTEPDEQRRYIYSVCRTRSVLY